MATVQMYVRFGECDLFLKCRFLWSIASPLKVCTMGLCNEIQYVGLSVIHLIDRLTYYFIDTLLIRDFCSIFRNTRCKSEVKLLQPTRFYVISMSSCIIEFHAKTISTNFCSIYLQFKRRIRRIISLYYYHCSRLQELYVKKVAETNSQPAHCFFSRKQA